MKIALILDITGEHFEMTLEDACRMISSAEDEDRDTQAEVVKATTYSNELQVRAAVTELMEEGMITGRPVIILAEGSEVIHPKMVVSW